MRFENLMDSPYEPGDSDVDVVAEEIDALNRS